MNKLSTPLLLFVLLLAAIPIFYNLAGPAIFIWDEAIYANNALEMALHGDPIVLYNNGEVSLYNTKPPLVIWLQCLAVKMLGPTEWAIRLPSALAAFLTALMLWLFARHSLQDQKIGIAAILVLVTTPGFIRNHVARSGDLDAVLIFWIVFYSLLAFHYLLHAPPHFRKYFTWIGVGILGAFLSKSAAGLMPLLGLALAALWKGRLWSILKKPYTYGVLFTVLAFGLGYYFWRENMAAGYLDKVWYSEYCRLTQNVMPWHEQPFWFYAQLMWQQSFFMPYVLGLPLAFVLGLWKPGKIRDVSVLLLIFCTSYFLLISFPSVKLQWYAAPLYPFFSLIIGVALARYIPSRFFYPLLLLLFAWPYYHILGTIQNTQPVGSLEREGYHLRDLQKKPKAFPELQVLMKVKHPEHIDQANFYVKAANHYSDQKVTLIQDWKNLKSGIPILCCQQDQIEILQQNKDVKSLTPKGNCWEVMLGE